MLATADLVRSHILAALPGAEVEVRDTTGGGDHFAATVVSALFRDKSPLDRHRMIYAALGELMKGPVHALALTTVFTVNVAALVTATPHAPFTTTT